MDQTTIKQIITNFVTGHLVTYFKTIGQKIDDDNFNNYQIRCVETAFSHIFQRKVLDASCSDFECEVSLKAKKLYEQLSEKKEVCGSPLSYSGLEDEDLPKNPPALKEETVIKVGDFEVFTHGSGEMFIKTSENKTYRCKVEKGCIVVAATNATVTSYGGCSGIMLY